MLEKHGEREEGVGYGTSVETAGDLQATGIAVRELTLFGGRFLGVEARDLSCFSNSGGGGGGGGRRSERKNEHTKSKVPTDTLPGVYA